MQVEREFSQNAAAYDEVNIIQKQVVSRLLSKIEESPRRILDIGCGNGTLYKRLHWRPELFVGIDFAEGMLALHPKSKEVVLLRRDFNDPHAFNDMNRYGFDRIVSASALQWAKDLDMTLERIASLQVPVSLAIFTSNTFKTLYDTANLAPILPSAESIEDALANHFSGKTERVRYTLSFDSVREMFRYMKKSGVGGGRNILSYKRMRALMASYPLDYLEYEVVFLHERFKRSI